MQKYINLLLVIAFSIAIFSCGEKGPEPVAIESLETYQDEVTQFEIKYPANWNMRKVPGERLYVLSSEQGEGRFRFSGESYSTGFPAARLDFLAIETDSVMNLDSIFDKNATFDASIYQKDILSIDGTEAHKYTYSFDLDGGPFMGQMIIAKADTGMASIIKFEAFDGSFDMYKAQVDEMIASIKLAKTPDPSQVDTVFEEVEADPPTMTLKTRSGEGYSIGIPDNFAKERFNSNADHYQAFLGQRRGDSFILIEKFNAKGLDAKKIAEQQKGSFGGNSPKKSTLGGQEAYTISWSPSGNVKGKVWFAVKNDKLYRVTLNWFVPEESDFYPPFEKAVNSFKFQ